MKDLIIVGAGGFGREAYYLAKSLGKWRIKGFIDDQVIDLKFSSMSLAPAETIKKSFNPEVELKDYVSKGFVLNDLR